MAALVWRAGLVILLFAAAAQADSVFGELPPGVQQADVVNARAKHIFAMLAEEAAANAQVNSVLPKQTVGPAANNFSECTLLPAFWRQKQQAPLCMLLLAAALRVHTEFPL